MSLNDGMNTNSRLERPIPRELLVWKCQQMRGLVYPLRYDGEGKPVVTTFSNAAKPAPALSRGQPKRLQVVNCGGYPALSVLPSSIFMIRTRMKRA
jgi:hypothetical protein